MTSTRDRWALPVLVLGAVIIGLAAVLARLTDTGPAAAGFWRLAFALPILSLMAGLERRRARQATPAPSRVLVLAGVLFAADVICWHYSLRLTSVANSTVLANLTPVLLTAVAWIVFKTRPARLFLAGLAMAVCGAAIMAVAHGQGGAGTHPHLGDALATFTTIWYGGYFLAVREARKAVSATTVMLWSSAVGAPILILAALLLREPILPTASAGWLACVGLGLVHVAGQGAIAWSLGKLPTALAAVVVLVQPVVAGALGWVALGESIGALQALGAVITLTGIVVAQRATRSTPEPAQGEPEPLV